MLAPVVAGAWGAGSVRNRQPLMALRLSSSTCDELVVARALRLAGTGGAGPVSHRSAVRKFSPVSDWRTEQHWSTAFVNSKVQLYS